MEINGFKLRAGDVWLNRDGCRVIIATIEPLMVAEDVPNSYPIRSFTHIIGDHAGENWYTADGMSCTGEGKEHRNDLIKPAPIDGPYIKFEKEG